MTLSLPKIRLGTDIIRQIEQQSHWLMLLELQNRKELIFGMKKSAPYAFDGSTELKCYYCLNLMLENLLRK